MLETIGKYKIIDKIGTGAMGVVYKGFDTKMGRYVAIKTMSPQYVNNDESRARFYKEAIAPAKLFHPNIVNIYDLDEENGVPFIVMEFLDGLDLKYFRSANIRFSIPQVLNILLQTSLGLDYAHKHGIIHRDVKPANIILLKNGIIKILDFGIARVAESTLQTRTGIAMGTPAYMSPEQAKGQKVDPRTDQYAVGVIAYEMIHGSNPFHAENYTGVLYKILNHSPEPLRDLVPDCPEGLSRAIMRTLEKERDQRFPDLKAFAEVCKTILQTFEDSESRLELAIHDLDSLETAAAKEPYKVRLIRKYIKEFQFEAASRLLERLSKEDIDGTLVASLRTELANQSLKKRCSDLLKLGLDLLENADYDLALANFNEVLELDPENVDAITSIQKARRLKKEALFKTRIEPLLKEAGQKRTAGAYLEAIELYRKILTIDPEYLEVKILIEETEKLMARANRVLLLNSEIRKSIRTGNLTDAFTQLEELESLAPQVAETRETGNTVWQQFRQDLDNGLQGAVHRERLPELRDWLTTLFTHPAVIGFFARPAHQEERNRFIQDLRRQLNALVDAQHLDAVHMILGIVLPVFPRQQALQSLATEVENLRRSMEESRQRQAAMEEKLTRGVQEIRDHLEATRIQDAARALEDYTRQFPGSPILASLREEVAEATVIVDQERHLKSQIDQARSLIESGAMEQAGKLIESLEHIAPQRAEIKQIRQTLTERQNERIRQEELRNLHNQIEGLRQTGRFDEAIDLARRSLQQYPEDTGLLRILEALQIQKAEHEQEQEIAERLDRVAPLINRNQFLEASKRVYELRNRFSDNTRVIKALEFFHEKRFDYITNTIQSARSLAENQAFDEARKLLEHAATECPDSLDLKNAIQEIVVSEDVQRGMAEARRYLTEKKYDLAMATVEQLLARYPEESNIVAFYTDLRDQRNAYIKESIAHGRAFARENDYDRALSFLRTAAEIVPNAAEIQEVIDAISRERDAHVRQRQEAAEEARLMEKELEHAISEARKFQSRGNLFDALRTLEQTRRRFPRSADRLETFIQEIQELIDLQMHLPETELPVRGVGRRRHWPLLVSAAVLVVAVTVVVIIMLQPGPSPTPAPPPPATLVVDLKPWGEVVELIYQKTGAKVPLSTHTTPLQFTLRPGDYRLLYRFSDSPDRTLEATLHLKANEFQHFQKTSTVFEKQIDQTVDQLLKQSP